MTNLIMIAIPFIAGIAIGGGLVMMFINQRKIPLDQWTERHQIEESSMNGHEDTPILIMDTDDNFEVCRVIMSDFSQRERISIAYRVRDALNRFRG